MKSTFKSDGNFLQNGTMLEKIKYIPLGALHSIHHRH
jgi:hypothetical protein